MAAWKKVVIESSAGNISQKSATSGTADNITSQGALATLATVDTAQIDASAITTAKIAADAVTAAKIGDNIINSEHYAAGSIDTEHMSANSVDSAQYVDGSIDLAHMSVNSIDSDQYVDGSIDTAHFAAGAVTNAKLADDAVDRGNLLETASATGGQFLTADAQSTGFSWVDNPNTTIANTDTTYALTAVENNPAITIRLTAGGSGSGDQDITFEDGGGIGWSTSGTVVTPTLTVPNDHITHARYQNIATGSLIYRKTAGTGDPEVNTLATLKTDLGLTGTNSGDQTIATRGSLGLDTDDSPTFAGLTVSGELTATSGTVTLTGQVAINDDFVILNSDATGNALNGVNVGFEVERGNNVNAKLLWREAGGVADGSRWEVTMQDDNGDPYTVPLSVMGTNALKDDVSGSVGAGAFYQASNALYCYL